MADPPDNQSLAQVVQDISERAALLVREEIELAKLEVTEKVTHLLKGAVVGIAAGVFVITGLLFLLHGFAWLAWYVLPVGNTAYFWGFFVVAGVLFIMGGIGGYLAARFVKYGSPPKPDMAIDQAQRIKKTLQDSKR